MATKKISELEAINAAEDNDVLVIVDTSESTTNKITKGNLLIGAGHTIEMTLNENYQIVLVLKNAAGTALSTQTIDLPNENAITNLAYNNGKLTITKQSGATSQINLTGLIEGLVTETDFNTFTETLAETIQGINETIGAINVKNGQQDEAIAENYKVINKLNEKLEDQQKVISQLPQVEGQGTEITLENTIEAQFTKFDIEGHSEQESTEGYQLLDIYSARRQPGYTTTINGVTITYNDDGTVKLNGTATAQVDFYIKGTWAQTQKLIDLVVGDIYTVLLNESTSIAGVRLFVLSNGTNVEQNTEKYNTFTAMYDGVTGVLLRIENGTALNNYIVSPMIAKGTYTKFEKFTYGASPNPNYEQPIKSAGDNENEFDIGTSIDDYYHNNVITELKEKEIRIKVAASGLTYSYRLQNFAEKKQYAISAKASNQYGRIFIRLRNNEDTAWLTSNDVSIKGWSYNSTYTGWYKDFNSTSINTIIEIPECLYWQFGFGFSSIEAYVGTIQTISNIKIEQGNKASGYSPYGMGSISEKIVKKNLFNKTINILDNMTINNNTMKIVADNTCKLSYLPCKPNTTYTISRSSPMSDRFWISTSENIPKIGETLLSLNMVSNSTTTAITMTTPANAHYMIIRCIKNQVDNYIDYIATIQVEYGNQATTYTSYQEQDYSIFVQKPMRSIGDVKDVFFKNTVDSPYYDENLTLNGWYERHYIGEVILNGSENWNYESGRFVLNFLITALDISGRQRVYSNYFEYLPSGSADYGIFVYKASSTNSQIYIYDKDYTTIEGFKAMLVEKYASGNPVYVNYLLAEPLDLPCTETQIQQLENKPSTYKDFTIIQSEDETPAYLEVAGIYDLNKLITRTEVLESES